jgi:uncharacterized protein
MITLGYLASVFMGVSLGLIGGGGSILTVPILFYFFNQDPLLATTNSLFVVGITALVGVVFSFTKSQVDFKTGFFFAAPGFVGVYLSRQVILPWLPNVLFSVAGVTLTKPILVMILFSILMVFASLAMIQTGSHFPEESGAPATEVPDVWNVVVKGFLVGCTTGFVGAGGGFLIIPALVVILHLPIRMAIGTSLAIIAANSLFGFMISSSDQATDWGLLIVVCSLGAIGVFLGQLFSSKVTERHLKKGFGVFVLATGTLILTDQVYRML